MTRYYIDSQGNYIGAFCGNTGIIPDGAIEVETPPESALQVWNGTEWIYP